MSFFFAFVFLILLGFFLGGGLFFFFFFCFGLVLFFFIVFFTTTKWLLCFFLQSNKEFSVKQCAYIRKQNNASSTSKYDFCKVMFHNKTYKTNAAFQKRKGFDS